MINAIQTLRAKQAKRKAAKARAAAFRQFGNVVGLGLACVLSVGTVGTIAAIVGHYFTNYGI